MMSSLVTDVEHDDSTVDCWTRTWHFHLLGLSDQLFSESSFDSISFRSLLIFRVFAFLFLLVNFVWVAIFEQWGQDWNQNASYLTHWTLAVVNVYFLLVVILMLRDHSTSSNMSFLGQLCLLTGQTALAFSVVVVSVSWILLYDPTISGGELYANIFYHGLTLVLMSIDFLIGKLVFVWRHIYYAMIYGAVYLVINAIYTLSTGIAIYDILTWQDWVTPAVIVGIFALLIGLWWVFIRLVRIRDGSPVSEHELLPNDSL